MHMKEFLFGLLIRRMIQYKNPFPYVKLPMYKIIHVTTVYSHLHFYALFSFSRFFENSEKKSWNVWAVTNTWHIHEELFRVESSNTHQALLRKTSISDSNRFSNCEHIWKEKLWLLQYWHGQLATELTHENLVVSVFAQF